MLEETMSPMRKARWPMLVSVASLVIAVASLVLVIWTLGELRQSVVTRSVTVVTPSGRIRLGVLPGRVLGIQIYAPSGKERIGLGVVPRKITGLAVYDAAGRQRFHLMFFDASGRSELKIVR
jgi:hypothetical protein